jgi:hypothetical protein
MPKSPRTSLLDELRRQSEALRAQQTAARQPVDKARDEIDSRLLRAFRWLDEAVGHLEVIRPAVKHQFRLGDLLTFDQPQFDGGFVSFRRRGLAALEGLEHVELYYRLAGPRPFVVRVNPLAATGVEERLRASALQFRYETEHDEANVLRHGVFHVEPLIAASVRFEPDYRRQVIDVTLRNVDRFESVQLEFEPGRIDESALEDLVRFVLGESNGFLHRAPLAYINSRHA